MNRSATDDYAIQWRQYIESIIIYCSLFSNIDDIDLNKYSVQRNSVILTEILERSRNSIDLLEGIPDYATHPIKKFVLNISVQKGINKKYLKMANSKSFKQIDITGRKTLADVLLGKVFSTTS